MAVVVVVKTQFSLGSGLMLAKCCQQMARYARLIGNAYLFHIIVCFRRKDSEIASVFGPRRDKTCLRGFRQSEIQTSLLSYRD